jgi:cobyrinic acid a,c-diamide synthase
VRGFLVASPHSGSGKTTITLGILRALANRGVRVAPAKAGPDFIDPAFHAAATGRECVNLDPWAMRAELVSTLAYEAVSSADLLIVEGMMGLFDGAADGRGSSADLAEQLGLPVVLVIDCAKQSQSVAALVEGFVRHRENVVIAGLILNRVGSDRHEAILRAALGDSGVPILGVVHRNDALELPSRHLGLVQAGEHDALELFLEAAARHMAESVDLGALTSLGELSANSGDNVITDIIMPPGQRIAIALDECLAFSYPHLLRGWRNAGAELSLFSPLADEAPRVGCDMVYLPGGYPELFAARLSSSENFCAGMNAARKRGAVIYGECGGFMLLGEGLVGADGSTHRMLGFLPLETSFAVKQRHLGYRRLRGVSGSPFPAAYSGHEFHYSTISRQGAGAPMFHAEDALGNDLGASGLILGNVCGSYMHLVDLQVRHDD